MSITEVASPTSSQGATQQALARHFKQRARTTKSGTDAALASDAQANANRAASVNADAKANCDDEPDSRTQWA